MNKIYRLEKIGKKAFKVMYDHTGNGNFVHSYPIIFSTKAEAVKFMRSSSEKKDA